MSNVQLVCPIRGVLKTSEKAKNKLTYSEEYYRIQAINHLLSMGYPKENFVIEQIVKKFGNNGRNSVRCDFAVLNVNVGTIQRNVDTILEHSILFCEVKRDNTDAEYAKNTQVKPLLDFAKIQKAIGLYWDNLEQKVFWQDFNDGKRSIREGLINLLPKFGMDIQVVPIKFNDTKPTDNLIEIFNHVEDLLHQRSFDNTQRYDIILKLLLAKIFDEHSKQGEPNSPMVIQDFNALGFEPKLAEKYFNDLLVRSIEFYGKHLPKEISKKLPIQSDLLLDILKILAPIRITYSKRDIIQTFYMKFAKELYKWDLAQFFTPTPITDFIVDVVNLKFGEHVLDPACGSADFLVAAFHVARKYNVGHADYIWGNDNSESAVQVAILNMVLNGDGKTNIRKIDSLESVNKDDRDFNIVLCNPPFGSKIVEKRNKVLKEFDLGYEWDFNKVTNEFELNKEKLLASQEAGLLFAELCVKKAKKKGRIAIILPNGYLGNRSEKFIIFRQWLLKNTRIAGICSLPRFSFKSSGADVSASILFLEKREHPVNKLQDIENYQFFVEMVENLGWEAGNKIAKPVFKRNLNDGSFITDEKGDKILDTDFPIILDRIRNSTAANNYFEWMGNNDLSFHLQKNELPSVLSSHCVDVTNVIDDNVLTLDPKRYSQKVHNVRNLIKQNQYVLLGDIVDFIPEKTNKNGNKVILKKDVLYNYVQIENISYGEFSSNEMYGWQLPSRAKHLAEFGDLFFGSIWGSASKWCYIGEVHENYVFTNGCHRCRIKKDKEHYLVDLLAFLNTEAWAVQMRSMARGSDGLAEISILDAKEILIPLIKDSERKSVERFVDDLKKGTVSLKSFIQNKGSNEVFDKLFVPKRPSHIVLV